jgi:hypothetical protein
LSIDELVDAALGINHAQGFDLNVDLHLVDVDDVAPPTIKLSDTKRMGRSLHCQVENHERPKFATPILYAIDIF